MPVYNKLVRDKIPEIIEKSGKQYTTKILHDEEYKNELRKKLSEELEEYLQADNDEDSLEELADMLEIIRALSKMHGATIGKVEGICKKKAMERGSFEEKIFLIEVL